VSDIDTATVDSLKVLNPNRPIREADIGLRYDRSFLLSFGREKLEAFHKILQFLAALMPINPLAQFVYSAFVFERSWDQRCEVSLGCNRPILTEHALEKSCDFLVDGLLCVLIFASKAIV
jgi:hypothetical protein